MKIWLEKALNHYLSLDPDSHDRMLHLQNKIVQMELQGIQLIFQLKFVDGKIQLRWNDFVKPDLTIKGTPLNLLHMSLAREQRQRFFAEDVQITGNLELARHVLAIFDELAIDWEEQSSKYLGDVTAHHLGRFLREIKEAGQHFRRVMQRNVNEYIHEEINLVPQVEALHDFFYQVDEFRMDVDRLEARVLRLRKARGME